MLLKNKYIGCLLILLASCFVLPLTAQAESTDVQMQVSVTQENIQERSFNLQTKVWSDNFALQNMPAQGTVMVVNFSEDMMYLAESPESNVTYISDKVYKSMDENSKLYTADHGEYKPVILKDNEYFIAAYREGRAWQASDTKIGEKNAEGSLFTQTVYEKGETPTRFEQIKSSLWDFTKGLAELSRDFQPWIIVPQAQENEIQQLKAEDFLLGEKTVVSLLQAAEEKIQEMKTNGVESINLIYITDKVEEEDKLRLQANNIKINGSAIYTIGLSEKDNEQKEILEMIASQPTKEHCYLTEIKKISDNLAVLLKNMTATEELEMRLILDSRFEVKSKDLTDKKYKVQQNADNTQTIYWKVSLPWSERQAEQDNIRVYAKEAFWGGNHIPVLKEGKESGLYNHEKQQYKINIPPVNVPLKEMKKEMTEEIFLGQSVPTAIKDKSLLSVFFQGVEPSWFGKEPTGDLSYTWQYPEGARIGKEEQLGSIIPLTDESYQLVVEYTPYSDGENAVGTPCQKLVNQSIYHVKLTTGKVILRTYLSEKEALENKNSMTVFQLKGKNFIRYRTLSRENRSEDGENIVWETSFDSLPFGVYSLINLNQSPKKETRCVIGFDTKNESIQTENNEIVILVDVNELDKNEYITAKERKFQINGE